MTFRLAGSARDEEFDTPPEGGEAARRGLPAAGTGGVSGAQTLNACAPEGVSGGSIVVHDDDLGGCGGSDDVG